MAGVLGTVCTGFSGAQSVKPRYPALEAWWDELGQGVRTPTTSDALYRAACEEANAREFEDLPELHRGFMAEARRVIEVAVREVRSQ